MEYTLGYLFQIISQIKSKIRKIKCSKTIKFVTSCWNSLPGSLKKLISRVPVSNALLKYRYLSFQWTNFDRFFIWDFVSLKFKISQNNNYAYTLLKTNVMPYHIAANHYFLDLDDCFNIYCSTNFRTVYNRSVIG